MTTNTTLDLTNLGQRIWIDNLSRDHLDNNYLAQLISEYNVSGVTSNPTIFYNAIKQDTSYQTQLNNIKTSITNPKDRYENLVIPDIIRACQLFRPIYDKSAYEDGYVSLEVSPLLANDSQATIKEALKLWQQVNQANLMIKIPATPAGIEAIAYLIAQGININTTLIFSLKQLRQVSQAYINGLTNRLNNNLAINSIKGVASFFMSRIDSAIDPKLPENLQGKTAITLAKVAYKIYEETFNNAPFSTLKEKGAKKQDLLWASTATKNPKYNDCLYVNELIVANTVNTLPDGTLKLFKDHGTVANKFKLDTDAAVIQLEQINNIVNLQALGEQLQADGLQLFNQSFEQLLELVK